MVQKRAHIEWLKYITHARTVFHNITEDRKILQILSRPTLKLFMVLQKYYNKQYFMDTTFWQEVC